MLAWYGTVDERQTGSKRIGLWILIPIRCSVINISCGIVFTFASQWSRANVMSPVATDYCNRIISRPLFRGSSFSISANWIFIVATSPRLITQLEARCYADYKWDCLFAAEWLVCESKWSHWTVWWVWRFSFLSSQWISGTLLIKLIGLGEATSTRYNIRVTQPTVRNSNFFPCISYSRQSLNFQSWALWKMSFI